MSVQYRKYKDIDIRDFDAVVVGAGFAGSIIAQQLAERLDDRVLILDKSDHIGGCMYDDEDESGIRVNAFGPHVFHTDDERVYEYITRFTEWHEYRHTVQADWYDTYLPLPFNENAMDIAFGDESAMLIKHLEDIFGKGSSVTIEQLQASADKDVLRVADFVYRNIFEGYSRKQWGADLDQVDPLIMGRLPIRLSREDTYYRSRYQGVPEHGYTSLFNAMLDDSRITVCLDTEAESAFGMEFEGSGAEAPLSAIIIKDCVFLGPIIFTGPIDELFLSRFGRLPYRSVEFVFETLDTEYALPCGTVNCTVSEDYTRITECKRLSGQKCATTTLVKEYPCPYDDPAHQTPLYPIINAENAAQHKKYIDMVADLKNFHPIGRLAEYRYYDMDQIVARALQAADRFCSEDR